MAAPNIVNTTSIFGRTDVAAVGTAAASITTNSGNSGKVYKVNSLIVSNVDGTNDVEVNVDLFRTSLTAAFHIARTVTVPADSSLIVVGRDNPVYLAEGDAIRLTASATGDAEALCSYEEIA